MGMPSVRIVSRRRDFSFLSLLLPILLLLHGAAALSPTVQISTPSSATSGAGKVSPLARYCVVESCEGCRLVRLKEVRQFVSTDLPTYENAEFRRVPGKAPEMIFYAEAPPTKEDGAVNRTDDDKGKKSLLGEVVERLDLTEMDNREELNKAMQERGFRLKPEYRSRRGGAAAGAAGRGREGAAVAARLMRGGRDDGEL